MRDLGPSPTLVQISLFERVTAVTLCIRARLSRAVKSHSNEGFRVCVRTGRGTAGPSTTLPRIPVELGGVGELHAAFFTESRTRGHVQHCVAGNPGTLRSG
jgi:hypothetical protein